MLVFALAFSVLFHMVKNIRSLNQDEALEFFRSASNPHLITMEADYLTLRERANLEFLVREKSEYLIREKEKYVLLGMRPIQDFRSSRHGRNR